MKLDYIKDKALYILLIGIIFSICIAGIKYVFSDTANRHGDYLFIGSVK